MNDFFFLRRASQINGLGILRISVVSIAFLLLFSVTAFTQSRTVSGIVQNETNGEAIPMASIMVKGTSSGTSSDEDGNFSISVPEGKDVLQVLSLGFKAKEVELSGSNRVVIQLEEEVEMMEEFVVRGYGIQKSRNVTGSISTVDASDLKLGSVNSIDVAMQGMASGLQVSESSGVPGAPVRIMIRGTGSINSGTEPLYIVDGIPIYQDVSGFASNQSGGAGQGQNPLADLNPSDIESVDVLKDASATAIYGSRGANGVVIITTKRGKEGEARVDLSYKTGITTPVRMLKFANSKQWFEMFDEAQQNSGVSSPVRMPIIDNLNSYPGRDINSDSVWSRLRAENTDVDYLREYIQNGFFHDIGLNLSGGTERLRTFMSLGYKEEQGISVGNVFKRYNGRLNIDYSAKEWLDIGTRVSFSHIDNNRPITGNSVNDDFAVAKDNKGTIGGFWSANKKALPIFPVYDDNGDYFAPLSGSNTVASIDRDNITDNTIQNRFISMFYAELAPFKNIEALENLKYRSEASVDYLDFEQHFFLSGALRTLQYEPAPYISKKNNNNMIYNLVNYINYAKMIGDDHDVSMTIGSESTSDNTSISLVKVQNPNSSDAQIGEYANVDNPEDMKDVIQVYNGNLGESRRYSYYARGNYVMKEKYLTEFSYRIDRSSKFVKEYRTHQFVAGSAGWILSSESFIEDISQISFLKVKGSYGVAGNDKIPDDVFIDIYDMWSTYAGASAYRLTNLGLTELSWEKSLQSDVGFEFGLYHNRITGAVSYYNSKTTDMLLSTPVSYTTGVSSAWLNVGSIRNSGLEFDFTTVNMDNPFTKFKWTTTLNLTTNANKVLELSGPLEENPYGIERGITLTRKDGRLGAFYIAEHAGIDENGHEMIYAIDQDKAKEGVFEKTGDKILATVENIENNKMLFEDKTGIPTYFGGLSNNLTYGQFDLNIHIYFQGGNYIYDAAMEGLSYVGGGSNNVLEEVYENRWTEENPSSEYPKLLWNNTTVIDGESYAMGTKTTRFLYKGDYLRLRSVTLGYSIPRLFMEKVGITSARIYFSAHNLFTLTAYKGYDPENVVLGDMSNRNLGQGYIGNYNIPLIRSYVLGVTIGF